MPGGGGGGGGVGSMCYNLSFVGSAFLCKVISTFG